MKTRFIFNPKSGHNARNPHLLDRAREFIRQNQLDAEVVSTTHPRHATELAREAVARGCGTVVAIGGDGTMNEVAAALVDTPATLGLIPCGSGNGLGRHLGIPGPGQGAFANLLHGHIRTIDTGIANGRPFFNVMGLGFDAEISERFAHVSRRGFGAYIRTTLSAWRSYRAPTVLIRAGAREIRTCAFILSVANSDQFGNNCYIAPAAKVDDGLLDLTVLQPVNVLQALPLAVRLFTKTVDRSKHALTLQADRFVIERDHAGLIHTDGEPFATDAQVTVAVRPASLRVLVPRSDQSAT
ncbi:MAG: diacylglycerol kinase family lipid kinase [Opitutaceae bacterium]|nr:diacylglycerol kinase family lipid kinase [Cephaloticoccus sp.]MCP5530135.1 diacylglycerol kinase family lipid kinase [Opitutaceae bacterium]